MKELISAPEEIKIMLQELLLDTQHKKNCTDFSCTCKVRSISFSFGLNFIYLKQIKAPLGNCAMTLAVEWISKKQIYFFNILQGSNDHFLSQNFQQTQLEEWKSCEKQ